MKIACRSSQRVSNPGGDHIRPYQVTSNYFKVLALRVGAMSRRRASRAALEAPEMPTKWVVAGGRTDRRRMNFFIDRDKDPYRSRRVLLHSADPACAGTILWARSRRAICGRRVPP